MEAGDVVLRGSVAECCARGNHRAEGGDPDGDPALAEGVVDACGESALGVSTEPSATRCQGGVDQAGADPVEEQAGEQRGP